MPNWLDDMEEDLDPVQYPDENEMQNPPPVDVPADDSVFSYAEPQPLTKTMNPDHLDYLKDKYNIGERQKLIDQNNSDLSGPDFASALASIGAGFQGKDALGSGLAFRKSMEDAAANKLEQFDKSRAAALEDKKTKVAQDQLAREMDPSSLESKAAQDLALQMGVNPEIAKNITAAKFKGISPAYQKMYELKQRALDRQESQRFREDSLLAQMGARAEARQDRLDAREDKKKELNAVQSKQRSLYESGLEAEKQYQNAINKGYDDSSSLKWIDKNDMAPNFLKSDAAIEAESAKSRWIESFLRDASGAAIPESERNAYKKQFFPVAGDSPQTVKDKAAARKVKMDAARVGSGADAGKGTPLSSEYPKQVRKGNQTATVSNEQEEQEAMAEGFQ